MTWISPVVQLTLTLVIILAAYFDIRSRRIPNWVALSGVIAGIVWNTFLFGTAGLRSSALGLCLAFAVYFALHLIHAMGAGDVKLMAAVGALVGPANWFGIFLLTAVFGAIAAVIVVTARGRFRQTLWNVGYICREIASFRAPYLTREELDIKSARALRMPHGVSIAMGAGSFLAANMIWLR